MKKFQPIRIVFRRNGRRALASAALLLGLGAGQGLVAQNFATSQFDPFNLTAVNEMATPDLVDIDNDGDFDMFLGEKGDSTGIMQYFENIGTATSPNFGPAQENPFGISPVNGEMHPRFVDMDGDGDWDLFAGEFGGDMMYMENIGTVTNPSFATPQRNPFNLTSCNDQAYLSFPDLDGDGDYDMLAGEVGGDLQYFENIGSDTMPAFAPSVPNPFNLTAVSVISMPVSVDLDGDGDFDFLVGESEGNIQYFENTGTATNPNFFLPQDNPFGIEQGDEAAALSLVDIDADGDLDLFNGGAFGSTQYQENREIVSAGEALGFLSELSTFPNPTAGQMTINLSAEKPIGELNIALFDLSGRQVMAQQRVANGTDMTFNLDLSELATGVYQLQLRSDIGTAVEKVVVD
jgi:hypothetical protein